MVKTAGPKEWLRTAGAALILALPPLLPAAPDASAAENPVITWSVRPSDGTKPDDRGWVEQELGPGKSATEHLALTNSSVQAVKFKLIAADGYFTDAGRFTMLPSTSRSTEAGTWIKVQDSVTVEPGKTAIIPFTTTVPATAEPGDHAAGIAATILSTKTDSSGAALGINSRVGFRVMTRVPGTITPALSLHNVSTTYEQSWNPFIPGRIHVSAEAINDGNARLTIKGTATTAGISAELGVHGAQDQELLARDHRTLTTTIDGVWPLFAAVTDLSVTPTQVSRATTGMPASTASVTTAAVPWPQLLSLIGLGLLIFAALNRRSTTARRTKALIERARQQGPQEASEPTAPKETP
jgi:hypothetical protein